MTYGRVIPQCGVWIGNTGLAAGERYLIVNPFFHSFGLKVGWVACLISGAVMVPMPQFDVARRRDDRARADQLPARPADDLPDAAGPRGSPGPFDSSSLRGGTTGAATVPPVAGRRVSASELGMKDIITAYGMTECVNITSCRAGRQC
jgi:acyl-CoA synthetase (AMP-forming)/AMP-acid ligase II